MSIHSSEITLEQAKKIVGETVYYGKQAFKLKDVREINSDGKRYLLSYFNEGNYVVNFALLKDKEGRFIENVLSKQGGVSDSIHNDEGK